MDYDELGKCNFVYLKEKAIEIGIPLRKKKIEILHDLTVVFKEHEARKFAKKSAAKSTLPKVKDTTMAVATEHKKPRKSASKKPTLIIADRFIREKEIRSKTKDTTIYEAKDTKNNSNCTVKCFRCDKALSSINRELELHKLASDRKIAPQIIYYDEKSKKIFYEHMDMTLEKYLEKGKTLSREQQNRILMIMRTLDDIHILYADPHPRNFLMKNNNIYTIEFTNSKKIDPKLTKKLETESPNRDLLLYKFVKYMKESNIDPKSYVILNRLFSNK